MAHWRKGAVVRIARDKTVTQFFASSTGWAPVGLLIAGQDVYVLEDRVGISELLRKTGFGGPRLQRVSANGMATLIGTAK